MNLHRRGGRQGREEGRVVEKRLAERVLVFPYIPGLLAFREAPSILRKDGLVPSNATT